MFKIDTIDAASTEPSRPAAGSLKFFSNTLRTTVSDWWLNMVQNEIAAAVTRFGLSLDKTNDSQLGEAIQAGIDASITAAKVDTTYIDITSNTTTNISQSSTATYNYPIADFLGGTGLETDDIRGVHVQCDTTSLTPFASYISAEFPDGDSHTVNKTHAGTDGGAQATSCVAYIPIKPGQLDFDIEINIGSGGAGSFTIVGVTQRVA